METILFGIREAFTAAPMHTLRGHGFWFCSSMASKVKECGVVIILQIKTG